MSDNAWFAIILFAMPLVIIMFVSWVLHYVVALNSPPAKRAAWVVGPGYGLATGLWIYGWASGGYYLVAGEGVLSGAAMAFVVFLWWRDDFRRSWIDDSEGVPEGVELANSDWRIGLIGVAVVAALLALRAVIRLSLAGQ